jgi:flavin-dependent dehydrogenase
LTNRNVYDVAIIGGGLAGLSLSIQLARSGFEVAFFEKEKFPFHRVCGEYISLENWNFLQDLGLPLSDWNLPQIKRLLVSAPDGHFLESNLPLGGFGISRYKIDASLAAIARLAGASCYEECKVTGVSYSMGSFQLQTTHLSCSAKMVCGCFGKRSNLDVKWNRHFISKKNDALNNYIGVKYHIRTDFPPDMIALHNFKDGYCGISRVESDRYCLCYLTTAANLQSSGNSVATMEKNILSRNPFLEKIFRDSEFLFERPEIISQVSFEKKEKIENHIMMIGDAAGMIAPLCGNGMSMALHGSKIAFKCLLPFLKGQNTRAEMEADYVNEWERLFGRRLKTGRLLQHFFGSERTTDLLIKLAKPFPKFVSYLIRQTHGAPY